MNLTLKNVKYFKYGTFCFGDFSLPLHESSATSPFGNSGIVSNFNNCFVFPAFCDVHVHLREPGFSYKETIKTGTLAAARGGYTDICSMPNLNPVPDSMENLSLQLKLIADNAVIRVHPYAAITVGQKGEGLSDFDALCKNAIAFSDDGRGVQNEELMRKAMQKAKHFGKIIAAHCEDNSLINGGYIHDGQYAKLNGHKGICSESEWRQIERDLKLAKEIGCKYHVCHVSCKESVALIRKAKHDGVDVTCETAPHYLILNDMRLQDSGDFKMNPPIRSEEDRLALIEGIKDGTIDMIATDHAPHSKEEKSGGLKNSLMGIVGIETAFAALYTHLVKTDIITLEKLIELMAINPRKRFGLPLNDDICVFDLDSGFTVNPEEFLSKGRATPFKGERFYGVCKLTVCNGKIVYKQF
ncbi:MAG: dihydroorotase [Acutalibacteraceae bacterium]|jgi:dihydroorotase